MYIKQADMQVIPSFAARLSFLCPQTRKYPADCLLYIHQNRWQALKITRNLDFIKTNFIFVV